MKRWITNRLLDPDSFVIDMLSITVVKSADVTELEVAFGEFAEQTSVEGLKAMREKWAHLLTE